MKTSILLSFGLFFQLFVQAATLPANFNETRLAQGLDATGVLVLPDDRIIITEKGGKVWLIKNDATPTSLITIPNVDVFFERGLQGAIADPDFASNKYIYFYYTYKNPANNVSNNRIVRYTLTTDVADPATFQLIFEMPILNAGNHNGGGMAFGNDGFLYLSSGDNAVGANSQNVDNLFGKILRIEKNGTIPTSNPFYATNTGTNRAVFALGLRNPFRLNKNRITGQIVINEVGQNTWEEIDTLRRSANYGWPGIEGMRTNQTIPANYSDPLHAYNHTGGNCSITGGGFYAPANVSFPLTYNGKYFFMDYCAGYIAYIDPANPTTSTKFATGLVGAVDLAVDSKGNMYYLERGATQNTTNAGELWKVTYSVSGAVAISLPPQSQTVSVGAKVTFTVQTTGSGTITYQWKKNGVDILNAKGANYVIDAAALTDNGAKYSVSVSNGTSNVLSTEAFLTVIKNDAPVAVINTPTNGTLYEAGSVLNFVGSATDTEDGVLPASAFSWKIDFHHDTHIHPGLDLTAGVKSGSLSIPDIGENSSNVWYRIYLSVKDSKGEITTVQRDIYPKKVTLNLTTIPTGSPLLLDGSPVAIPFVFVSVVGMKRTIEAPILISQPNINYAFANWSNAGTRAQIITTPSTNASYTATYETVKLDTLSPLADAYVRAGTNSTTAFGATDPTLLISKKDEVTLSSNREIYLRFPLPKYTGVLYSFLQLTGSRNNTTTNEITVNAFGVENVTWNENTISWDTKSPRNTTKIDSVKIIAAPSLMENYQWNVKNYIEDKVMLNNTLVSFALANSASTPNTFITFNSKEAAANRPKLIVIYKDKLTAIENEIDASSGFKIYPNPSNNGVFSLSETVNWTVYSVLGEELKSGISNSIHLSEHPKGVYLIKLNSEVVRVVLD